jgi:hypothetical protein
MHGRGLIYARALIYARVLIYARGLIRGLIYARGLIHARMMGLTGFMARHLSEPRHFCKVDKLEVCKKKLNYRDRRLIGSDQIWNRPQR